MAVVIKCPKNILLLSGTHGNEMSGIYLYNHWKTDIGFKELERSMLCVTSSLAMRRLWKIVFDLLM